MCCIPVTKTLLSDMKWVSGCFESLSYSIFESKKSVELNLHVIQFLFQLSSPVFNVIKTLLCKHMMVLLYCCLIAVLGFHRL